MSPPTPSPRFCRKNCVANARDRVSDGEQSTIIVASAGCITACPAPSAAADDSTVAAEADSPRLRRTERGGDQGRASRTGSGPRRTMARPANGSTINAATAKTASTRPAVTGTESPYLRHIDVQVGGR